MILKKVLTIIRKTTELSYNLKPSVKAENLGV